MDNLPSRPDRPHDGSVSRRPSDLPAALRTEPFRTSTAHAHGVTRVRLRAADLEASTHGVRSWRGGPPQPGGDIRRLLLTLATALPPDVAFSHLTAARLWDLPDLPRAEPHEPVHVARASGRPPIERRGCQHHRGLERRTVVTAGGLRVTDPVSTWLDLAATLSTTRLVVIGDFLLARRSVPRVSLDDLQAAVASRRRSRGYRRLVAAVGQVRVGAASPMESRSRLVFASWGLPEPELNVNVYDEFGQFLGRADFLWRNRRVLAEYDGDQHRTDRAHWLGDRARRLLFEAVGWTYVEFTSHTLIDPELHDGLRRRLRLLLLG